MIPALRPVTQPTRTTRWRLACFDLDGTLVRGTSVSQYLAEQLGQGERMAELERQYASGAISNSVVAEEQAKSYGGIPLADIVSKLAEIPCIGEIDATILGLRERGIESILGTVTGPSPPRSFAGDTDLQPSPALRPM